MAKLFRRSVEKDLIITDGTSCTVQRNEVRSNKFRKFATLLLLSIGRIWLSIAARHWPIIASLLLPISWLVVALTLLALLGFDGIPSIALLLCLRGVMLAMVLSCTSISSIRILVWQNHLCPAQIGESLHNVQLSDEV